MFRFCAIVILSLMFAHCFPEDAIETQRRQQQLEEQEQQLRDEFNRFFGPESELGKTLDELQDPNSEIQRALDEAKDQLHGLLDTSLPDQDETNVQSERDTAETIGFVDGEDEPVELQDELDDPEELARLKLEEQSASGRVKRDEDEEEDEGLIIDEGGRPQVGEADKTPQRPVQVSAEDGYDATGTIKDQITQAADHFQNWLKSYSEIELPEETEAQRQAVAEGRERVRRQLAASATNNVGINTSTQQLIEIGDAFSVPFKYIGTLLGVVIMAAVNTLKALYSGLFVTPLEALRPSNFNNRPFNFNNTTTSGRV